MAWGDPLPKAPERPAEDWDSNDRIQQAWEEHVKKRGAKNTQRNLIVYNRVLFRSFDVLVTDLEQADLEAFVARIETKCSRLLYGQDPSCRLRLPIASCPVLHDQQPYTRCSSYRPLLPSGTWSYLCAANRLFEWLREKQRIGYNPCLPVMRDFRSRHVDFFSERLRKPKRRKLTEEEVKRLVTGSPIQHAIGYLVMAKCFLRIHEAMKLSWNVGYCDLDEGWMDIPADWNRGNKRQGNHRIIIDTELRTWIRRYRAWWEDRVKRDEQGNPVTQAFLITTHGDAWGAGAIGNFNSALHENAIRVGLMTGLELEREERVNSHCFRAFATTWARKHGIRTSDLQLLRGDLGAGSTLIRYEDYLARLPELYRDFSPLLELG